MTLDLESHEFDSMPSITPLPVAANVPNDAHIEQELEAVPLWPLPVRTFAVQPPPKLTSGNAPSHPLDKTLAKVRKWRIAQREIRGIAGGRWFARSWVGDTESPYAAAAGAAKGGVVGPVPGPLKQKKFKFLKPDLPPASALGSGSSTPAPLVPDVYIMQQDG